MFMSKLICGLDMNAEAFAVCENYSPPEGFNPKDLHRLLEKVGSPSGGDDLGKLMYCLDWVFTYQRMDAS